MAYALLGVMIAAVVMKTRGIIYDAVIVSMTESWYKAVLERLPAKSHVLDVGIGTGAALLRNRALIEGKQLTFVGVDYDQTYIDRCNALVEDAHMQSSVSAVCRSIYDYAPAPLARPFTAAYFSGSLMIMPDPVRALAHVRSILPAGAPIYTTQTFETKRNRWLEAVKPLLKFVTTIDFGNVTYERDFLATVAAAGLDIAETTTVSASSALSGAASRTGRAFKLYKLLPKGGKAGALAASASASAAAGSAKGKPAGGS